MNGMPVGNVLQKDHLYEQVADHVGTTDIE